MSRCPFFGCRKELGAPIKVYAPLLQAKNIHLRIAQLWKHYCVEHRFQPEPSVRKLILELAQEHEPVTVITTLGGNRPYHSIGRPVLEVEKIASGFGKRHNYNHKMGTVDWDFVYSLEKILILQG